LVLLLPLIILTGCLTDEQKVAQSEVAKSASQQITDAISQQDQVRENLRIKPLPRVCGNKVDPGYKDSDSVAVLGKKADIALFEANNRIVSCYDLATKRIRIANTSSAEGK
jgi:hypothetical protein